MKAPKGFGKKYFTFSSILAYAIQSKIHSIAVKTDYLIKHNLIKESEELDENDPPLVELLPNLIDAKPCHCNLIYKLKIFLTIKAHTFIPRCPYYTTYFAFRRSGIHPPYYL